MAHDRAETTECPAPALSSLVAALWRSLRDPHIPSPAAAMHRLIAWCTEVDERSGVWGALLRRNTWSSPPSRGSGLSSTMYPASASATAGCSGSASGLPVLDCTTLSVMLSQHMSRVRRLMMSHARRPVVSASSVIAASLPDVSPRQQARATALSSSSVRTPMILRLGGVTVILRAWTKSSRPRNLRNGFRWLAMLALHVLGRTLPICDMNAQTSAGSASRVSHMPEDSMDSRKVLA